MSLTEEDVKEGKGFAIVPRGIQRMPWYGKSATIVWLHLRLNARYKPDILAGVELKEGEWLGSIQQICNATGLTVKTVRHAVDLLKEDGEIKARVVDSDLGKRTVFTLCSWACMKQKEKGQPVLPLAK